MASVSTVAKRKDADFMRISTSGNKIAQKQQFGSSSRCVVPMGHSPGPQGSNQQQQLGVSFAENCFF
jgi:hypothetical protein